MASQPLCARCLSLPAKLFLPVPEETWSIVIKHSPTFSLLETSALNCPLCALFLQCIENYIAGRYSASRSNLVRDNPAIVLKCVHKAGAPRQRCVYIAYSDKKEEDIEEGDYVMGLSNELNLCYPEDRDTVPFCEQDLDSEASFDLAKKWLENCSQMHESCSTGISGFLPTRLIEVGSEWSEPRLRQTADFTPKEKETKYTTLSYCWGPSPSPSGITDASTLAQHLKSITLTDLPQTLQDAIIITRRLNIKYIWIDSLCILQKSLSDWHVESANMSHIYSNSYVTIAATTAPTNSSGCLKRRSIAEESVELSWPDEEHKVSIYPEPLNPKTFLPNCSLAKRGWTLQESLLSPRTIHYTISGLMWTCGNSQATWQDPKLGPQTPDAFAEVYAMMDEETVLIKPYKKWREAIEEFSKRSLTVTSDRLPALAGLAGKMQAETGDVYLAGLWKGDLVHDLCWYRDNTSLVLVPSSTYIAPSWSWASRLGAIRTCFNELGALTPISGDPALDSVVLEKEIERTAKKMEKEEKAQQEAWREFFATYKKESEIITVIKAEVISNGQNPLGELSSGSLTIYGTLKKARISREDLSTAFDSQDSRPDPYIFQFNCPLVAMESSGGMIGSCTPDFELSLGDAEVHCLQLSSFGVVLILKDSGQGKGAYERVGLGYVVEGWFEGCMKEEIVII